MDDRRITTSVPLFAINKTDFCRVKSPLLSVDSSMNGFVRITIPCPGPFALSTRRLSFRSDVDLPPLRTSRTTPDGGSGGGFLLVDLDSSFHLTLSSHSGISPKREGLKPKTGVFRLPSGTFPFHLTTYVTRESSYHVSSFSSVPFLLGSGDPFTPDFHHRYLFLLVYKSFTSPSRLRLIDTPIISPTVPPTGVGLNYLLDPPPKYSVASPKYPFFRTQTPFCLTTNCEQRMVHGCRRLYDKT